MIRAADLRRLLQIEEPIRRDQITETRPGGRVRDAVRFGGEWQTHNTPAPNIKPKI